MRVVAIWARMRVFAVFAKHVQHILLCGMEDQQGLIQESKEQKGQEEKKNLIISVKLV
jgi:hypothetical protein